MEKVPEWAVWALVSLVIGGIILYLILQLLGISGPREAFEFFGRGLWLIFVIIWARLSAAFL